MRMAEAEGDVTQTDQVDSDEEEYDQEEVLSHQEAMTMVQQTLEEIIQVRNPYLINSY